MGDTSESKEPRDLHLPPWADELITMYESGAISQFILYGNVSDRLVLPLDKNRLGGLRDFLYEVLLPRFDVILNYDLGNGLSVERGTDIFSKWPDAESAFALSRKPRPAIEMLTRFFRYCINLGQLERRRLHVASLINAAHLMVPAGSHGVNYDLSAMALLMRNWSEETIFTEHSLVTFLVCENLNDLHPLLVNNSRVGRIKIPLPTAKELERAIEIYAPTCTEVLAPYQGKYELPATQLVGASVSAVERLLRTKTHRKEELSSDDLAGVKKQLVENDCNGLIEFIDSNRSLDDIYGQEKIKTWFRQDIALWHKNDLDAMPMGYLLCGPVGTGKTYLVNCLAGEAGVSVVKLKNFRDKWVGSSEGNLEKIFRLLHALGRCIVFIDEADQALGSRNSGSGDSNVSGRLYSMMAEEMSNTNNRGKILWVLASSRPDLIEVDLKRPGRVDVKIPLFPTTTAEEGFHLIRALCKKVGLVIPKEAFDKVRPLIPMLVTPGAAEALAVKVYRIVKTESRDPVSALEDCLDDYQNPIAPEVMDFQIQLAVREASYLDFVPKEFRISEGK